MDTIPDHILRTSSKNGKKKAKKKACKVNGRRVQTSWTAPYNDAVDYRVFVNNANVNGDGNRVASGTIYAITSEFSVGATVTIRVRTTDTYWSEVVMEDIIVRGEYLFQLCTSIYQKQYVYHHHSDVCNFFCFSSR